MTNAFGRQLSFTYDNAGRIATMTDPDGGVYTYAYGANDNLTQVTYPDQHTRQYLYKNATYPHALTGIVDENGNRFATWTYDAQGRASSSEHANGTDKVTLSYNADGTTTVSNALGQVRTYHFTTQYGLIKPTRIDGGTCASCGGDTRTVSYDNNGFIASRTDFDGNTTTYINNYRGLQTSRTEAAGTPQARTITTAWNPDFRLPVTITEPGKVTHFTYDTHGQLLTRTETDTATGAARTWTYTYTAQGLLASVDGPRTDVADTTTYTYDPQGNLTSTTDALGHVSQLTAHDASGRPLTLIDANGLITQLSYDPRGRLLSRTVGGETTTLSYDAAGNLTGLALPDGQTLNYQYDAVHRLTGITDTLGNHIAYTRDAAGHITQQDVTDPNGTLTRTQHQVYNTLGRLVQRVGAAGQTTTYAYDGDGNRISAQDAVGNTTTSAFDALSRLVNVTDAANGNTAYTYDAQDRITRVTTPNGATTTYTYDGLGDRLSRTSPDTGTTTYTYDAAGNVISQTDAKGQTTTYTYDALNRVTQASYADGTSARYSYDAGTNGIGHLTGLTDASGSTAWTYDAHGRVLSKTQTLGGVSLTLQYTYNSAGQLTTLTYPSGLRVSYTYTQGLLSDVQVNGTPLLSGITYQPFGPVSGWTWADGSASSRTYDLDGRLVSQSLAGDTRTLNYDPVGDITGITDSQASRTYGYDALMRLTAANDATHTWAYTYDANGNRTGLSDLSGNTTYSYAAASNRLQASSGAQVATYTLDADGNTVNDGTHRYAYDARNRLTTVDGGTTATYTYNAQGQRVEKTALQQTSGPDYAALATQAAQQAQGYHAAAQQARQQARAVHKAAKQLAHQARTLHHQARRAQHTAARLTRQAQRETRRATSLTQQASRLSQRAHTFLARLITHPTTWWQRLLNRLYHRLATVFQHWADTRTAQALQHQQRATADTAQATTQAQQATALQHQADALTLQAQAKQTQAQRLQTEARRQDQLARQAQTLAAHYRQLATQSGGTTLTQVTTVFAYDGQGHLIGGYDANGQSRREYIWLGDRPVALVQGGKTYALHTDQLGTPRAVTDPNGTVVWRWDGEPFGHTAPNTDPDGNGVSFTLNLRFPGQYADTETGLYYNWFRYYDPATGRYISSDPIGLRGGVNTYGYVNNNPLSWFDYFGLDKTIWWNSAGGRNPITNGPTNGNWGGKCWSGGAYSCDGNPDGSAPPTDSADACYKAHDKCYEQPRCSSADKVTRNNAVHACDAKLVQCLRHLPKNPKNWPIPPRRGTIGDTQSYKSKATWLFSH